MLSAAVREEAVELLVAAVFCSPGPYAAPASHLVAFWRFLDLLLRADWSHRALVLDPAGELAPEALRAIQVRPDRVVLAAAAAAHLRAGALRAAARAGRLRVRALHRDAARPRGLFLDPRQAGPAGTILLSRDPQLMLSRPPQAWQRVLAYARHAERMLAALHADSRPSSKDWKARLLPLCMCHIVSV
jgi:hypothetical protein